MKRSTRSIFVLIVMVVCSVGAYAESIDFSGLGGGSISYAGGASSLIGTNLPISGVYGAPPGSSSNTSVSGGLLNFGTGAYTGNIDLPGSSFMSFYNPEGYFRITGGIPAAGVAADSLLLEGYFVDMPMFTYAGSGLGSMTGSLGLLYVNPLLTSFFGFGSQVSYGAGILAQVEMNLNFNGLVPAPAVAFSGTQGSINLAIGVPTPGTFVPIGIGLAVLFFKRKTVGLPAA